MGSYRDYQAVSRRRPVRDVLLACMLVLLLAQGLTGMLSLSALNRLVADTTTDRIQVISAQNAAQIQTGLGMGKPLAQYFGLQTLLQALADQIPDLSGASVVLADGQVQAAVGQAPDAMPVLQDLHANSQGLALPEDVIMSTAGVIRQYLDDSLLLAVPLFGLDHALAGALVLQVADVGLAQQNLLVSNAMILVASTLGAALLLVVLFRYLIPLHVLASGGKARTLAPVLVLLLAQGVYAACTIHTFKSVWLDVTRDNSQILGQGLQKDLNRVLGYGIAVNKLHGVEQPMMRLAAALPIIQEVSLTDTQGAVLARANADGVLPRLGAPVYSPASVLHFPLHADGQGPELAQLSVFLDQDQIRSGVWARVLDAGTVAAVAVVVAIELLLLLGLLMNRAFAAHGRGASGLKVGPDDADQVGLLVRPVMFGFLFAWALPLGFLPLYARSLINADLGVKNSQWLMALPISVEMGCGLLTVLLAGRLTDKRGWPLPVLAGLVVSVAGSLVCALVDTLPGLVAARGMVGLGYGLTWMGLQGFIVLRSPAQLRGRNMASVIAGLFAGHLSGAAVGAMLMQQLGFQAVFYVAAFALCLPLLGVLSLMWPYRDATQQHGSAVLLPNPDWRGSTTIKKMLFSRDFGMLLIASIVPFSIAQVGLLTFALPLYLEAHGAQAASIGRVLMLYGLCVIYLGPFMGRLADQSMYKKYWIVAGGIIGSLGLISLYFMDGLWAAALAVVLLALASCLAGAAQVPYILGIGQVQRYGAAGATSLMRAADKFGQMLGPLVVAGLFASIGMSQGLAVTGAFYLLGTIAFLMLAPRPGAPPGR